MKTLGIFLITLLITFSIFGCKGSDLPNTDGDVPPPPSMEINDPVVLLRDAGHYIDNGKYQLALQAIEAAIKKGGNKLQATFLKGQTYLGLKKYKKALEHFLKAKKMGHPEDEIFLYIGKLYTAQNKLDKAIESFKKTEKIILGNPVRLRTLGEVLFQNIGSIYVKKNEYKKAIIYFNKAIKINPSDYRSFYFAGKSYYKINKYELAIKYLEKAIKLKPRKLISYKHLATVYYTMGKKDKSFYIMAKGFTIKQTRDNTEKAFKELQKISNIYKNQKFLELYIFSRLALRMHSGTEEVIKRAIKKYPNEKMFNIFLGRLKLLGGEYKKALKIAQNAINKYGLSFDLLILQGNIYIEQNKKKEAIPFFEKALIYNPENFTYRYKLATLYREAKKNNLEFLHQGIYFAVRGQYEQAKFALARISRDIKRIYEVNCWLGRVYMEQGVNNVALEYLNKSISQKPNYFLPYTFKCFVLFRKGKKAQGLAVLKSFMKKYPNEIGIKEVTKLYKSFSRF